MDTPKTNGEVKRSESEGKKEEVKNKEVKTYSFSKEDLTFLEARYNIVNLYTLVINDLNFVIQQYIISNFCVRHAIDPQKSKVTYDIPKGILTTEPEPLIVKPAPPEIVVLK